MNKFILFIIFVSGLSAKLIPTPLFTDPEPVQRIGWEMTLEYLGDDLFGQSKGISFVKLRVDFPETFLGVVSDETWNRLIYLVGVDSLGERYSHFFKTFDEWQNPQYFDRPMGVACDSTIFNNNPNNYFVYTADRENNRIVRSYYNSDDEEMYFYDYMLEGILSEPEDVACVSIPGSGSYLVIADTKNHRIRIVQIYNNLTYAILNTYGTEGSGVGQFKNPNSVTIVPCRDSIGYYRIYVVDQSNYRVISLLYTTTTNSIIWERDYTNTTTEFQAITSNPYYCVYVTDGLNEKIWVFTPGLNELLYTYGDHNQFYIPIDLCIYENEIVLTENWVSDGGIQHFNIIPEIREFYPEPGSFDATEDSVKVNFKVYETKHYLTMEIPDAGVVLFENQEFYPGSYSIYWDGRDNNGKVVNVRLAIFSFKFTLERC